MLDTGIDVPQVLNLVFFKPVRSKIKFVQMIGRGTRLCPGVFGPVLPGGKNDKRGFRIFDYCGNFEFFSEHPDAETPAPRLGITQRTRCVQIDLLCALQKHENQSILARRAWHGQLRKTLRDAVLAVRACSARIAVRERLGDLDRFVPEATWNYVSPIAAKTLQNRIVPLMDPDDADPPLAKSFDLRMYRIAAARLDGAEWPAACAKDIAAVMRACVALLGRASIPQVQAVSGDLRTLSGKDWWTTPDVMDVEAMRARLRSAMPFLAGDGAAAVTIDQEDEVLSGAELDGGIVDIRTYRQKAVDWLAEHGDAPAVAKIRNLEKLTPDDWRSLEDILWHRFGSEEDYRREIGEQSLAAFVRSIVGIEQSAVNEKYGAFLAGNLLSPMQQDFVRTILDYVRETGDITPDDIVGKQPFCDFDSVDLFQERLHDVQAMVAFLHGLVAA